MNKESMVEKGISVGTGEKRLWWLPWMLALALGVWWLAHFRYGSADPDSEFYAFLVKQIDDEPWRQWIAPQWLWRQEIPAGAFVRDHLVGHLIPPVLLSQTGYPSGQSIYAWNLFYAVATLWGFMALAKEYFPAKAARGLLWALQILPIAFLYRVRANHEQLVLLCVLWGAIGGVKMRRSLHWAWLVFVATHLCFLVKGVVFVMVPAAAAMALLAHFFELSWKRMAWFVGLLGVITLSVGATALAYEWAFRSVTGEVFFEAYWQYQILGRTVNINETHPWLIRKLINFTYYFFTSLWYSLPWTAIFFVAGWQTLRRVKWRALRLKSETRSPWPSPGHRREAIVAKVRGWLSNTRVQGVVILLGTALQYVVLFSASNRLAGRYIFPTFFFLGAGAFLLCWERWQRLRRTCDLIERWGVHRVSAALWTFFVFLTIVFQNAGD